MREYSDELKAKASVALAFVGQGMLLSREAMDDCVVYSLQAVNKMLHKEKRLLGDYVAFEDISEADILERLLNIAPSIEETYKYMKGDTK